MLETGSMRRPLISILIIAPPRELLYAESLPDQRIREAAHDADPGVPARLRASPSSTWTIRLQEVLPLLCPLRSSPSTRISYSRPTRPWLISCWMPVWRSSRRFEARGGDVVGDLRLAAPPRRRGAGPRRVAEAEEAREPDAPDEREGLFEVLVRLPRKPDDEVRGEREAGHARPDPLDRGLVLARRVPALHAAQDPVRARLRGQVQVGRDRAARGERIARGRRPRGSDAR